MLLLLNGGPVFDTILAILILIYTRKLGLALGVSNLFFEFELEACMTDLGLAFFRQHASLLKLQTRLEMRGERPLERYLRA